MLFFHFLPDFITVFLNKNSLIRRNLTVPAFKDAKVNKEKQIKPIFY